MLVGVPRMLCEIIGQAVAAEPDMVVVEHDDNAPADLGTASRRRRVDVIIFPAGANGLSKANICALLHANPRLGLVQMDGAHGRGTLDHLVPQPCAPSISTRPRRGFA